MWRILLPFLRFAIDCWLGLGAFAVMSACSADCRQVQQIGPTVDATP
jgi:hypothetical protein